MIVCFVTYPKVYYWRTITNSEWGAQRKFQTKIIQLIPKIFFSEFQKTKRNNLINEELILPQWIWMSCTLKDLQKNSNCESQQTTCFGQSKEERETMKREESWRHSTSQKYAYVQNLSERFFFLFCQNFICGLPLIVRLFPSFFCNI